MLLGVVVDSVCTESGESKFPAFLSPSRPEFLNVACVRFRNDLLRAPGGRDSFLSELSRKANHGYLFKELRSLICMTLRTMRSS
jgi:hypothetical protein